MRLMNTKRTKNETKLEGLEWSGMHAGLQGDFEASLDRGDSLAGAGDFLRSGDSSRRGEGERRVRFASGLRDLRGDPRGERERERPRAGLGERDRRFGLRALGASNLHALLGPRLAHCSVISRPSIRLPRIASKASSASLELSNSTNANPLECPPGVGMSQRTRRPYLSNSYATSFALV
mmetsp:Transcript_6593/g.10842  ORF Transcript_6593/g.10842 Transcript_6593/m.10842 type:complete len:179 (-) Transcript_6593:97-633(-)|eukprot:CAMPEP_0184647168 /NCGR_PEP_ID=MMETSP0308-20130426/4077_1 /TAXON_ID=38269 /ORGANISM="Gloeochaete witrockiana, Strain SAG 46.84" /LENGTH=178 /DNA_ID=CAMNT_0027077947 /DNA_START=587 /DNA_END=1123 /DNA_ORIENTATION=+